jgi:hypothetical protein
VGELVLSVALLIVVTGVLAGWAWRKDRRLRAKAEEH